MTIQSWLRSGACLAGFFCACNTGASNRLPEGYVDDASRMNPTPVHEVRQAPTDPESVEEELRAILSRARAEGRRVSIAGARHSMGGHTFYRGGIVLDMLPYNRMRLDEERGILHVGAGARWSQVIPFLDGHGLSVHVMQSNNDFSVGGSISVNCHGWQPSTPPIASTVEAFRLLLADGRTVRCSRSENAELFSLALGGYGLFGVILDVELRVVPNALYAAEQALIPVSDFVSTFSAIVSRRSDVGMAYGRLSIVPGHLFDEAILVVFRPVDPGDEGIPPLTEPGHSSFRRAIFRASAGSDFGKWTRWNLERTFGSMGGNVSRNELLNESAAVYSDRSEETTDILHEYFVPPSRLVEFLDTARDVLGRHDVDLLNVTVREVFEDQDSFLRYADQDVFALVMLFSQERTPYAEASMEAATRDLIEAALAAGGTYYLPYRPHARRDQFQRAYPQSTEFFALKRMYDPDELFQNRFYERYGTDD